MNTLSLPLNIRRGGSDTNLNFDVPDGILDFHKVKLNADSLRQKILKVTEQIKIEQTSRDGNVAEYLKLVPRPPPGELRNPRSLSFMFPALAGKCFLFCFVLFF